MNPRWRRGLVLVAAVLAVGLTVSLGRWQMHRADEKLARQAAVAERESLLPLNNASLPCDEAAWAGQANRRVVLTGQWLPQHTWLLDNRAMAGRAGFYVVTALQLSGRGRCASPVVLVQRGWVPRHAQDRTQVPAFITPVRPVQVVGRLMPELSRAFRLGPDLAPSHAMGPRIVQNIDFAAVPAQLGRGVMPGAVLQLQPETSESGEVFSDPSGFPLRRDWPVPADGVGKHHAYAAQWFAMAALITGLYVWFQLISPHRRRAP
ncbi:SURF1 family protein [Aquabacterium sp.]|uniref:SURF1 family protein n=1 Tax=Aquabacterium sp. TaxID=1872578 RepID=UPI003D6D7C2D